jgi:hypothetical protein
VAAKFLNGRIVHCKWSEVEVTTLSGKPQKAIEVSEVSYFFALAPQKFSRETEDWVERKKNDFYSPLSYERPHTAVFLFLDHSRQLTYVFYVAVKFQNNIKWFYTLFCAS